jgi:hypothetical protein
MSQSVPFFAEVKWLGAKFFPSCGIHLIDCSYRVMNVITAIKRHAEGEENHHDIRD